MPRTKLRAAYRRTIKGCWSGGPYASIGKTRATYCMEYFEDLGKPHLEDIETDDVDELRRHLTEDLRFAPSTVNQYLCALRSLYGAAAEEPPLTTYAPKFRYLPIRQRRNRTLSDEEETKMLAYFDERDAEMLDIVTLAVDTALRESELLRLREGDGLHLDDPEMAAVAVRVGKNDPSAADVPLTPRAAEVIRRRSRSVGKGEPLFKISRRTLVRRWDQFRQHIGLSKDKGFTFHCLRHTACTRVADSGLGVSAAQDFLRHGSADTTMRYIKASAHRSREARDVLARRAH